MKIESDSVYITKSNFESIIHDLGAKDSASVDYSKLYTKDLSFIFSTKEMRPLFNIMKSYEDVDFLKDMFIKVQPKKDTQSYVFEGGAPAYHYHSDCPRLHSKFQNLKIPPEIKHSGRAYKFRDFCKKNMDLLDNNPEEFYKKMDAVFILKNPPEYLEYANSGLQNIENMDLEQLCREMDNLLEDAKNFMNRNESTYKTIKALGYGTHVVEEAKNPGNPLHTWHNKFKVNLKKFLKAYYRVKLNPELKFDGKLMEQIGFHPCSHCRPK